MSCAQVGACTNHEHGCPSSNANLLRLSYDSLCNEKRNIIADPFYYIAVHKDEIMGMILTNYSLFTF